MCVCALLQSVTNGCVLASISDPVPIVALAYKMIEKGTLGGYLLGLFLCELTPHARWLPTEVAELVTQIRAWPAMQSRMAADVGHVNKRRRTSHTECSSSISFNLSLSETSEDTRRLTHPRVELVGNHGNNLAQVMIGLCGPASSWDSRWLHAVMSVFQNDGWTWAEIGEFVYELMDGAPLGPGQPPLYVGGKASNATSKSTTLLAAEVVNVDSEMMAAEVVNVDSDMN